MPNKITINKEVILKRIKELKEKQQISQKLALKNNDAFFAGAEGELTLEIQFLESLLKD